MVPPQGLQVYAPKLSASAWLNSKWRAQELQLLQVQQRQYMVHMPTLQRKAPALHAYIAFESNMSDAVVLDDHTTEQVESFLWAIFTDPLPHSSQVPRRILLNVAELAYVYSCKYLQLWALDAMKTLVVSHESPLRTARTGVFMRILPLLLLYGQQDLSISVQNKWASRIHWGELSPVPAIHLAYRLSLVCLLGHAFYALMLELAPNLASSSGLQDVLTNPPLLPQHKLHIMSGYHSFSTYWAHLQKEPPTFAQCEACSYHSRCQSTWKIRWAISMARSMPYPVVDVFRRLTFVEGLLESDAILDRHMNPECRDSAIQRVAQIREETSQNLHHHFDL